MMNKMSKQQLVLYSLAVIILTSVVAWLIWPSPSQVKLSAYKNLSSVLCSAYLDVNLKNHWQQQQVAFLENLSEGPAPSAHVQTLTLGPGMTHIPVLVFTPADTVTIVNAEDRPVTYQLVDLLDEKQQAFGTIDLKNRQHLLLLKSDYFKSFGHPIGFVNQERQQIDAIGLYLPHAFYVTGEIEQQRLQLPNMQARFRWLRFVDDPSAVWGIKVVATAHSLLLNEAKIMQLSFETPDLKTYQP